MQWAVCRIYIDCRPKPSGAAIFSTRGLHRMPPSTTAVKPKWFVEIDRLGLTYSQVQAFDLSRVDFARRVQVRDAEHYVRTEMVARYAVQMKESAFPPIIMTADDWIVDGNTRVAASRDKNGTKHLPAIVLDVKYTDADAATRASLQALAGTLNSSEGLSLTPRERRALAETLLGLGWNTANVARATGVSTMTIGNIRREMAGKARLARIGITPG